MGVLGSLGRHRRICSIQLTGPSWNVLDLTKLRDVVKVLRDDRFYELSPRFDNQLDGTHSVLTVRRCSVVTRVIISNGDAMFADPATRKLFADLLQLIERSKKDRESDTPIIFEQKLLFDQ
jgi:hypothetical protein